MAIFLTAPLDTLHQFSSVLGGLRANYAVLNTVSAKATHSSNETTLPQFQDTVIESIAQPSVCHQAHLLITAALASSQSVLQRSLFIKALCLLVDSAGKTKTKRQRKRTTPCHFFFLFCFVFISLCCLGSWEKKKTLPLQHPSGVFTFYLS